MKLRLVIITMLLAISANVPAEIPDAARQDSRFALGYLVVTAYPGVSNDGTGNSTAGIQQAIDDGSTHNMAVLFPAGEYVISDSLRCYRWQLWAPEKAARIEEFGLPSRRATSAPPGSPHILLGESVEGRRPVLRLATEARGFNDPEQPRPMISFRNIRSKGPTATEIVAFDDPMGVPEGFEDVPGNLFSEKMCNIDFDCGGNPGAIGVYGCMAQDSTIMNVRVNAEGAYAGFRRLPGRNSVSGNLEVQGGRFGLLLDGGMAGPMVVGLRLSGQTENALAYSDFCPLALVGFKIEKSKGPAIRVISHKNTSQSTMSLIDGSIEVDEGEVALDNSPGKTLYMRNVYVKGATNLVQSGKQEPVQAQEGWNCIEEYSYTDQELAGDARTYQRGDATFRVLNLIDGQLSQEPEPLTRTSQGDPPADLISRHVWDELPIYTGDDKETVVVTDAEYDALPGDDVDDASAIQKAIDAASDAGHGRVFLPRGKYLIGQTLELRANTQLMGAGWSITRLEVHPDWIPAAGEKPSMIRTVDDPAARTTLGMLTMIGPAESFKIDPETFRKGLVPEMLPPRNRFTMIDWRAGGDSMTVGVLTSRVYTPVHQTLFSASAYRFSGNGGGRHYSVHIRPPMGYPTYRPVLIDGTSQPLAIYGLNSESPRAPGPEEQTGMTQEEWLDLYALVANVEVRNAENVRIYSIKREGRSPSVLVRDSRNVAIYSAGGAMRIPLHRGLGGYLQFHGQNENVLATVAMVQGVSVMHDAPEQEPLLLEKLPDGKQTIIEWPESLAVYKRGEIDDKPFVRAK